MTRIPIAAGNWKMNGTNDEARALCQGLARIVDIDGVEVVLAPSFTQLGLVSEYFADTGVHIAGQNMHTQPSGAYTGEVSPVQLREVADTVILGHSERRQLFCEDDQALALKLRAAETYGLTPILCVGETEAERENRRTAAVLARQVRIALGDAPAPPGLIIAYEPVWAIGTGTAATPDVAQTACAHIRSVLADSLDADTAETVRMLYGGSVNPDNIADFMAQPDIDGALVGGASLEPDDFIAITRSIAAG